MTDPVYFVLGLVAACVPLVTTAIFRIDNSLKRIADALENNEETDR